MSVLMSKTDPIDDTDTDTDPSLSDLDPAADDGGDEQEAKADQTAEAKVSAAQRTWVFRTAAHWRIIAVCLGLLASAVLVSGLYFGQYRTDQLLPSATTDAVSAASQGSVALLSYAPDSVDRDLAAAESKMTGEFLTFYSDFAKQIVAPATRQKDVRTTATVVRAAPAEVNANNAKVLVFLNQVTTSRDNPDPAQTASSVMVGLTKVDGHWLISSFDPI